MISDLAHETIRLLDDFKSSSTDSRLLVLKDLETALNVSTHPTFMIVSVVALCVVLY